jgi:hypothetical protein
VKRAPRSWSSASHIESCIRVTHHTSCNYLTIIKGRCRRHLTGEVPCRYVSPYSRIAARPKPIRYVPACSLLLPEPVHHSVVQSSDNLLTFR